VGNLVGRQIERILDEDKGRVHSVIVQLKDENAENRRIIDIGVEALQRRNLVASARELVPPRADLVRKSENRTRREQEKLRATVESMTSLVTLSNLVEVAVAVARGNSVGALSAVMASVLVKGAIDAARRRRRKTSTGGGLPAGFSQFWSSRSALLQLRTSDLQRLPQDLPNVSAVFPNRTVRTPPIMEVTHETDGARDLTGSSWGIEKTGALAAWGAYGTRGKSGSGPVKIAVLDTGVDVTHPELEGKISDWAEFDENGGQVENSDPHDSDKHGTHVCGTIAGGSSKSPSEEPWIGMAPDAVLAVGMVLKGRSGTYAQILAGMDWAIESGASAINMSLGATSFESDVFDVYTNAILRANRLGIPVVVSIGNEGAQTTGSPGNDFFALAVGATDPNDQAAGFSGGRTLILKESEFVPEEHLPLVFSKPDMSAPGVAIRSCVPSGQYAVLNGTSMAAPHVAGGIALLLAATDIGTIPAHRRAFVLQDILISSVDELGETGQDHRFGFGRMNILRAITMAKQRGY